jgi:hypothetical protein
MVRRPGAANVYKMPKKAPLIRSIKKISLISKEV